MVTLTCSLLFFFLTAAICFFGFRQWVRPTTMLRQLDRASASALPGDPVAKPQSSILVELLSALGGLMPLSQAETSLLKKEIVAAGYRSGTAALVFHGLKMVLAAAFLAIGFSLRYSGGSPLMLVLIPCGAATLGYLLPGLVLSRLISRRQEAIRHALPDALDMLVVCCEAGCGLDQAILNVSREFQIVHPALSDESRS